MGCFSVCFIFRCNTQNVKCFLALDLEDNNFLTVFDKGGESLRVQTQSPACTAKNISGCILA